MKDDFEKRINALGVDTSDIKERDAYMRLVDISDRMETRIVNLMVENEELKDDWAAMTKKLSEVARNDKRPMQRLRKAAHRMSRRMRQLFGICGAEKEADARTGDRADGNAEDRGGEA